MITPNYTIEEKRAIVEEWMASGIARVEFCRNKGINPSIRWIAQPLLS